MVSLFRKCLLAATGVVLSLGAATQADVRIQGTGASFPAPLYLKWVEAYNKAHPDVKIDYQSSGSGAGIKSITSRTVTFGASDAPLSADQEKALPAKAFHLPMVAGPEAIIYNVPGVDKLKLNGEVIAEIYLKKITTWNDPKIAALNPGVTLPGSRVVVAHRSDGSGTTYIFTDFLSKISQEWADKVGKATTVDWPVGIGGSGSDGVAATVKSTGGAIGYVEYAYAAKNHIALATLINKDGKEVAPTIESVNAAAKASVSSFPDDLKVSITSAPGADSYPICGFTYILVYEDLSYLKDKPTADALVDYLKWCVTDGQEMAADSGYAKLPREAQDKVLAKLKAIRFNGELLLK